MRKKGEARTSLMRSIIQATTTCCVCSRSGTMMLNGGSAMAMVWGGEVAERHSSLHNESRV